ncbi:UDP-N-acetylmuramate--L-alanine ligase [Megamonas hypermegale]|uniref:UDP-N-acetylmuramate--L-alanine ligase n=1 Tax=Megamonas hypermegale TaxID=158847 RepID=UPI0025A38951|nr:UDP-N-acetylmuramate--L-alanine ligase [Megamonas hypermegale]MDM8143672.1 UDP-N-acetylmuramate--L-alanine ligase [Megamonas hypermegale]
MLENIRKLHFVGIGGVGMSAIAEVMLDKGYEISGSDLSESEVVQKLRAKGAVIYKGHAAANVEGKDAIVLSSAIHQDNPELVQAKKLGLKIFHRSDILAFLLNAAKGIAVAGAHGKTTTSSMISVVLEHAGVDPTILIGGFVDYLNGNAKLGKSDYLVAEADESDGSFLKFYPHIAVVTNIEDDHMDHYGSMENIIKAFIQFVQNLDKENGLAVLCFDNENIRNIAPQLDRRYISYALEHESDYTAADIVADGPQTTFTVVYKGEKLGAVTLNIPGRHNVLNALATIAVCHKLGLSIEAIAAGFAVFTGTKRRFQTKFRNDDVWIVDDYAHHPTEIQTTIKAARQTNPKRLVVAFQPHRYTRTQLLRKEFGSCFKGADVLILTDIYAASEEPIPGISGRTIVDEVKAQTGVDAVYIEKLADIAPWLEQNRRKGDLIITMGAGNIYTVGETLADGFKHE